MIGAKKGAVSLNNLLKNYGLEGDLKALRKGDQKCFKRVVDGVGIPDLQLGKLTEANCTALALRVELFVPER